MKKALTVILTLCLALSMGACSFEHSSESNVHMEVTTETEDSAEETAQENEPTWHYEVQTTHHQRDYNAPDDKVVFHTSFEIPYIRILCNQEGYEGNAPDFMTEVADAFNAAAERDAEAMNKDAEESAEYVLEFYAENPKLHEEQYPFQDISEVRDVYSTDSLLSILAQGTLDVGSAHPTSYQTVWNFDLDTGEFVDWRNLTDDQEGLKELIVSSVLSQIQEDEELAGGLFEDYENTLRGEETYMVKFGEKGMDVIFGEYELGPHAVGVLAFTIPYSDMVPYLNEQGERLLQPDAETKVVGNFKEALGMWYWFNMTTLPKDTTKEYHAEGTDLSYYRVTVDGIQSIADLRARLERRFSDAIVKELLEPGDGVPVYREIDGVLCGLDAARGSDVTVGDVEYKVTLNSDGGSGALTALIQRQEMDEKTGQWKRNGVTDSLEFPFELTEDGARFTSFADIW